MKKTLLEQLAQKLAASMVRRKVTAVGEIITYGDRRYLLTMKQTKRKRF